MRELAVFYCPKCGHYAYYQTSRHPQCPKCGCEEAMYMVRMHYTEFMRMSCDERDEFLSKEILKTNPSLVERLTAPHKRYNSREIIAEMNNVIMNLDTENKILNDTVKWMHDTIWDLMHEKRAQARDAATDMADGSPAVYVVDAAMVADIGNQAADTDVALGPRLLIWKTNQLVR